MEEELDAMQLCDIFPLQILHHSANATDAALVESREGSAFLTLSFQRRFTSEAFCEGITS
jgi:hypothetical protein